MKNKSNDNRMRYDDAAKLCKKYLNLTWVAILTKINNPG